MYISIEQSVRSRYPCYQFVTGRTVPVVANYIIPRRDRSYMEHHITTNGFAPMLSVYGVNVRDMQFERLYFTKPDEGYAKDEVCPIINEKNEQVGETSVWVPTAIAKVTGKASICKYTADFDDFKETYHTFVVAMGKQGYRFPVYRNGEQVAIVEKHEMMSYSTKLYDMWLPQPYQYCLQRIAVLLSYMDSLEFGAAGEFSYINHSAKSSLPAKAYQEAFDVRRSEEIKRLP